MRKTPNKPSKPKAVIHGVEETQASVWMHHSIFSQLFQCVSVSLNKKRKLAPCIRFKHIKTPVVFILNYIVLTLYNVGTLFVPLLELGSA